jgi:hypothetical protein
MQIDPHEQNFSNNDPVNVIIPDSLGNNYSY